MKARILAVVVAVGLAVAAAQAATEVTYKVTIPDGPRSRQISDAMVAAIGPLTLGTAALRQSIVNGETSTTVIVARQKLVQKALLQVRDATLTSAKTLRKSQDLLSQNALD